MSANDKNDLEEYREKVDTVAKLLRRRPHNMTEEIEQRGFEWYVDDADDTDEIAEEKAARPENEAEKRLVSFLENGSGRRGHSLMASGNAERRCFACALAAVF